MSSSRANRMIDSRTDYSDNFIEVPKSRRGEINEAGNVFSDGFTGSIWDTAISLPYKFCAHEFGHLLGLGEMNTHEVPPSLMTQGQIKTPYEEYQVKESGWDLGTFDTRLRKLSEREIKKIKVHIQALAFKDDGKVVLNCNSCNFNN